MTTESASTTLIDRIRAKCARRNWYGGDAEMDLTMVNDRTTGRPDPTWKERRRHGFLHPPATVDALADVERRLGHSLPSALRNVYGTLANGGFGPGYGLVGIPEAALCNAEDELADQPRLVLCDWGCGITSRLDVRTGEILRIDPNLEEADAATLPVEASSVEEWLGRWVASDADDALFWDVYGGRPESE